MKKTFESPQFQIPSSCKLNMSPHELELMLFINENFLSPSIFDKVMKWAHSATAEGYKFDSPRYSTLKKQMNYTFPDTIYSAGLKSKYLRLSSYQKRLDHTSQWQCGTLSSPLGKAKQSPSWLEDLGGTLQTTPKVFFKGPNGCKFYYNPSQDKIGFIPIKTDDISVPPQFQIPSSYQLNMSPHELELMLFINENYTCNPRQ